MLRKKLTFLVLLFYMAINPHPINKAPIPTAPKQPDFFNTSFLAQYTQVTDALKQEGFKEDYFYSTDNLALQYLYLERPQATCNIILCAGWLPGRKEGLASFYKILPNTCNLFFFDARGHGNSQGPLLSRAWEYGIHEYKDILGALNFIHAQNEKPIVILGTCAGAFHAAHAISYLQENNQLNDSRIKGLIFDSGWTSICMVAETVLKSKAKEYLCKGLNIWYKTHHRTIRTKIPFKIASTVTDGLISILNALICEPGLIDNDEKTNLFHIVHNVKVPTLFIHSEDDDLATIESIKSFAEKVDDRTCWWIDQPSKHTCHHLKYQNEYKQRLTIFLNKVLGKKQD